MGDHKELYGMTKSHDKCTDETLSELAGWSQKCTTVRLKTRLFFRPRAVDILEARVFIL